MGESLLYLDKNLNKISVGDILRFDNCSLYITTLLHNNLCIKKLEHQFPVINLKYICIDGFLSSAYIEKKKEV